MALKMSYTASYGYTFPDAYIRIKKVTHRHENSSIQFAHDIQIVEVAIFADEAAYDANGATLDYVTLKGEFDDNDTWSYTTLYTWLKTLPQFAGAVDA